MRLSGLTKFRIGNSGAGSGNASAGDILSGKTASVDTGDITGTMPNRGTFNLGLGAAVPAGYYSGGTVPSGKKFASGSGTSDANSKYAVSGLSFQPRLVIIDYSWNGDTQRGRMVYNGYDAQINSTWINEMQFEVNSTAGTSGYGRYVWTITANGFSFPGVRASQPFSWIAIGD